MNQYARKMLPSMTGKIHKDVGSSASLPGFVSQLHLLGKLFNLSKSQFP